MPDQILLLHRDNILFYFFLYSVNRSRMGKKKYFNGTKASLVEMCVNNGSSHQVTFFLPSFKLSCVVNCFPFPVFIFLE